MIVELEITRRLIIVSLNQATVGIHACFHDPIFIKSIDFDPKVCS
jgi:hypothetical protein